MADKNLMSAISGLAGKAEESGESRSYERKEKASGAEKKEPAHAAKKRVVNLGKGGSFKINHPGGLHKATGTPMDEKIPQAKVNAALHSKNPHVRHMAASAKGFAAMKHGGD